MEVDRDEPLDEADDTEDTQAPVADTDEHPDNEAEGEAPAGVEP